MARYLRARWCRSGAPPVPPVRGGRGGPQGRAFGDARGHAGWTLSTVPSLGRDTLSFVGAFALQSDVKPVKGSGLRALRTGTVAPRA
jgi:hypothetical protein